MIRLTAPNGAAFEASDEMAPKLLAAGWKRAEEPKPKAAPRKRTTKAKE